MVRHIVAFFTENWGLKLAAVALAVLLWLAVRAGTPVQQEFRGIPVEVDVRDPEWRLAGPPQPPTVSITLTAPQATLLALARNPPRVVLPVADVNDSVEHHVVPPRWITWPPDVDLGQIQMRGATRPDTIRLRFERIESRSIPVRITTTGDLPEGYALALPITANPPAVEVRGPRGEIEALDSVPLFPVDLSGMRNTTNVPARVDTTDLEGLRVTPRDVNVILRVVPADSQPQISAPPRGVPYL